MDLRLSSLHISPQPRTCISTLPPELLHEVFHPLLLSKHDLAQCSLLSRHFLDIARKSLYRDLCINVYTTDRQDLCQAAIEATSFQLLETLRNTPELRNLVTGLDIVCYPWTELVEIETHRELFQELLELLPEVNRLFVADEISGLAEVIEVVHLHGHRWTEVEIYGKWEIDLGREDTFPKILSLDCEKIVSSDPQGRIYLPPTLHTLRSRIGGSSFPNASTSSLRSLWTFTHPLDQSLELAKLPQLETLALRHVSSSPTPFSNIFNTSDSFQQLSSLEVEFYDQTDAETAFASLSRLAPSLRRLTFRNHAPFKALATLLDRDQLRQLEILVLPKEPLEIDHFKERYALISKACERRSIAIKYVPSMSPYLFEDL